ncbi:MAG: Laccase domain protein YfiH [Microgenomates bacterium OLB23]|nr:MAG: Laccase domain protein YfiH [Microgenomates bacterium OLB23]
MIYSGAQIKPTIFPKTVDAAFGTKMFDDGLLGTSKVYMQQTHGDSIAFIQKKSQVGHVDGVMTSQKNTSLCVLTADCVPILYYDSVHGLIGVSHQGWRGTLLRMPHKMLQYFNAHGSTPESMHVAIGPSIGACCYEIYGERKNLFQKEFANYGDIFVKNNDKTMLNLALVNYQMLREAGVCVENIEYCLDCTACRNDVFYSYNKGNTGRNISYIKNCVL